MSNKFISFLGTNNYDKVYYVHNSKDIGGYISNFIQEALIKTVCKGWGSSDSAIILVTNEARELNWYNEKDKNRRLKTLLGNTQLNSKDVLIPTGQNEEEIWEIFDIVINNIEEGDKIVLDITHAFRYIPMLTIIILDYAKVIKNIEILGIYYGAWDVRDKSTIPNIAPIFDLTPLVEMQEWSQAVNTFIKYGNSGHLEQISKTSLMSKLAKENWAQETNKFINKINDFTMNISTCRGQMISERKANQKSIQYSTKEVKESLHNVKKLEDDFQLKPLIPLISKVEDSIKLFDESSTLNTGLATIEWCINNHLIQQAYTALEETLKTYICELNGLDANEFENRENIVNEAIKRRILIAQGKEQKSKPILEDKNDMYEKIDKISNSLEPEFVLLANNVKSRRNDINHFGFSRNVFTYKTLEKDIINYYDEFLKIINETQIKAQDGNKIKTKKMLLIFSHKLTDIQIKDAKTNLDVDEFIYLPNELQSIWSNISPYEYDINKELEGIYEWIDRNSSMGDYILIQGDFGATYQLVNYCKLKDLRPIYSTTKREAIEIKKDDNTIVLSHKVSHIRYREY